jgi:succinate-acetate transporter protein
MAQYATQTGQQAGQEQRAERMVSSITSPMPLGMIALAFATAIIGCAYAGFIIPSGRADTGLAVGAALFFGGLVQILAGMWEFRNDDTNLATIFTSYGGFLIAFGAVFIPGFGVFSTLANASTLHQALGLFFLCWTIISGVLFLGSLRTNVAMLLTLLLLFLAYLLLTIGQLASANTTLLAIGGWIAIVTGLVGWYTALAGRFYQQSIQTTDGLDRLA